MKYVKDQTGLVGKMVSDYPIASSTAIKAGCPVELDASGKVVAANVAGSGTLLGVAAETHYGAAYMLELKDRRENIAVLDSPHALFKCNFPHIKTAATGEDSITITLSAADVANGGKVICTAAQSGSECVVGTSYDVSDSTAAKMEIGKDTVANDEFDFIPPIGFSDLGFTQTDSDLDGNVKISSTGACLVVVGIEDDGIIVAYKKHVFGN